MTEPLVEPVPPSPIEFSVRVVWITPNRNGGAHSRQKVYKIICLSLLEACSMGLERHKANICVSISAVRTV